MFYFWVIGIRPFPISLWTVLSMLTLADIQYTQYNFRIVSTVLFSVALKWIKAAQITMSVPFLKEELFIYINIKCFIGKILAVWMGELEMYP